MLTPSSAAALTTVMPSYTAMQIVSFCDWCKLVTGLQRTEHITPTLKSLHWLPIRQWLTYKLATLVHKCVNGHVLPSVDWRPGMRSADSRKLHVPHTQTSSGDRSFAVVCLHTWNNLPDAIRDASLHKTLKSVHISPTYWQVLLCGFAVSWEPVQSTEVLELEAGSCKSKPSTLAEVGQSLTVVIHCHFHTGRWHTLTHPLVWCF